MNTSDGQLIESSVAIKQSAPLSPKISSNRLFWILNAMGWVGISLLTYFSLSLPYSQFELSYFAHNISQSLVGLLLTLPLRWCFKIV